MYFCIFYDFDSHEVYLTVESNLLSNFGTGANNYWIELNIQYQATNDYIAVII
jgi:hypothetical protein